MSKNPQKLPEIGENSQNLKIKDKNVKKPSKSAQK